MTQRKLIRWGLAYLAAAWVFLEAFGFVADRFGWPSVLVQVATILVGVGFFIALVLAWYHGEQGRQRVSGVEALLLTALAAVGISAVVALLTKGNEASNAPVAGVPTIVRDKPAVAVLPFDNISRNSEDAYLTAGFHEEVISQLSKVSAIAVISRNSMMRYRDQTMSTPAIAQELGVSAVLEGSVRRAGEQIRITAQLIDGRTDAHVWTQTYDRALTVPDLFAIQSEIAQNIVRELRARLTPEEEERINRLPTEDLAAYDLYLRGRQAYGRYRASDLEEAVELYREALALDPEFAMAWAGLGNAYAQQVLISGAPSVWADSAIAASERAIDRDPEFGEGYKALGLAYTSKGSFRTALELNLKAVALDPSHFAAASNAGAIHIRFGSFDEALPWSERSFGLSPNIGIVRSNVAFNYLALEEWDLAERWAREALAIEPRDFHALHTLSLLEVARGDAEAGLEHVLSVVQNDPESPLHRQVAAEVSLLAGDYDAAARHAAKAIDMVPLGSFPPWHFPGTVLGFTHAIAGDSAAAERHLSPTLEALYGLVAAGTDDPRLPWEIGCIAAIRANADEALAWLRRGYEAGWKWAFLAERDPLLDALRGHAGFERLLREMRSDVEAMRSASASD